jgi:hypothetical protein
MKNRRLKTLIGIILVGSTILSLIPSIALSGDKDPGCTIYGNVYVNNNPTAGITVNGGGQQATTDGSGLYQFRYTVPIGTSITLTANYNGHTASDTFTVPDSPSVKKDLYIMIETPTTSPTPSPSDNPSTTPTPSSNPSTTPQPSTRTPSDIDNWVLGPKIISRGRRLRCDGR